MGICDSVKENNNLENKDSIVDYISNKENNTKGNNNNSIIEINKYLSEISRVVCQINIKGEKNILATGFFLKFYLEKNDLYFLLTNYHVITKEIVDQKKNIYLDYDFKKEHKKIKLDTRLRIIIFFEELDITLIEITDIDNINKKIFLSSFLNNKDLKDKRIYIVQYPYSGENLSYSKGIVDKITENNTLTYNSDTNKGSSGSPILLENTNKVIGIHKEGDEYYKHNRGTLIYPIINYLKDNNNLKSYKLEGFNKYIFDDESFYIGNWKNGMREGKGKLFDKNNNLIYEGDWIKDKKEGIGKQIINEQYYCVSEFKNGFSNGKIEFYNKSGLMVFKGNLDHNKERCFGKILLKNNYYYEGDFINSKRTGNGKIYNKDNILLYEGVFINGKIEGKGRFNYSQGYYYIGEWKNGQRNGLGKLYYNNGELIFDGKWENNIVNDIGKEISPNGLFYYYGGFKNGIKEGSGEIFNKNGKLIYEGYFINNKPECNNGFLRIDDGFTYRGDFKNGFPDGSGKIYYNNKTIYEGEFVKGSIEGMGRKYFENGDYYFGEFKNNKMEGFGEIYDKNGNILCGDNFYNNQPKNQQNLKFIKGIKNDKYNFNLNNEQIFNNIVWTNNKLQQNGIFSINDSDFNKENYKDPIIESDLYDKDGKIVLSEIMDTNEIFDMLKVLFE